jgi:transcriptional regulator with XRE-family HTH domain
MTPVDLRHLMHENNLSSGRIARALGVGRSQVSRWRTGERPIPRHHLQQLQDIFAGRIAIPAPLPAEAWSVRRDGVAARGVGRQRGPRRPQQRAVTAGYVRIAQPTLRVTKPSRIRAAAPQPRAPQQSLSLAPLAAVLDSWIARLQAAAAPTQPAPQVTGPAAAPHAVSFYLSSRPSPAAARLTYTEPQPAPWPDTLCDWRSPAGGRCARPRTAMPGSTRCVMHGG